jgi:hypothetical protein
MQDMLKALNPTNITSLPALNRRRPQLQTSDTSIASVGESLHRYEQQRKRVV